MSLKENSLSLEEILTLIPPPVRQATPTVFVSDDGSITVTATQKAGKVSAGTKTVVAQVEMPEPGSEVVTGTISVRTNAKTITINPGFVPSAICVARRADTNSQNAVSCQYVNGRAILYYSGYTATGSLGGLSATINVTISGSDITFTYNGGGTNTIFARGTYEWMAVS